MTQKSRKNVRLALSCFEHEHQKGHSSYPLLLPHLGRTMHWCTYICMSHCWAWKVPLHVSNWLLKILVSYSLLSHHGPSSLHFTRQRNWIFTRSSDDYRLLALGCSYTLKQPFNINRVVVLSTCINISTLHMFHSLNMHQSDFMLFTQFHWRTCGDCWSSCNKRMGCDIKH